MAARALMRRWTAFGCQDVVLPPVPAEPGHVGTSLGAGGLAAGAVWAEERHTWGNYNNDGPLAIAFGGLIFLGKGNKMAKRYYCL